MADVEGITSNACSRTPAMDITSAPILIDTAQLAHIDTRDCVSIRSDSLIDVGPPPLPSTSPPLLNNSPLDSATEPTSGVNSAKTPITVSGEYDGLLDKEKRETSPSKDRERLVSDDDFQDSSNTEKCILYDECLATDLDTPSVSVIICYYSYIMITIYINDL